MTWDRSLGSRLFGVRRRSRRLRHELEHAAATAAREAGGSAEPADAAYHDGERAAYVAALGRLADNPPMQPSAPPPHHRAAWQRGYDRAADHAKRLFDQLV